MATMSSYEHPDDNRGPMVLGWLWTTTILAILGVMMRLYARLTTKAIGWDDYLIIAATAVTVFGSSVNQVMVDYGFGRHVEYVLKDIEKIVMWTIIAELQSYLAIGLVKLSVCWFILRMIQGTHRFLRASILVLMAILGIMVVVAMLLDALQCFPLEKAWKEHLPGRCISKYVLTHFTIAIGGEGLQHLIVRITG
ncbi:hypothetical protein HYALB_00000474 [Hymenoscyphus albidus]|uniref:Rhodopsin domain-containing protein n=1 Tax=Hymenoscyphus albidus TaxID=595503 RepID=A0A9N9LM69_9HELO|nr:hypothetical protein HYALB_00000474 [Hymenoscyphus albidus]